MKSLKNLLIHFKSKFRKSKEGEILLPRFFSEKENIIRSIYSSVNLNSKGEIRNSAFRSPAEIDEVSVNRGNYCSLDFCKSLSKRIENPSRKRTYFGLANLTVKQILKTDSKIVYSPILELENKNLFHSDIKIGYKSIKGEPLPAEFQQKVNKLAKESKLYEDPNPSALKWTGDQFVKNNLDSN